MRSRASELGLMKKGITEWATEVFKQADADGSDELSVIEARFHVDISAFLIGHIIVPFYWTNKISKTIKDILYLTRFGAKTALPPRRIFWI